MTSVSVAQEIAAPPAQVWAMVADVTRMGEWSPETVGATWLRGAAGPVVGAKFKGKNRNGARRWSTTCTVTESVEGVVFEFHVKAATLTVATWRYDFAPTDGGGTLVTETWTDDRGGVASFFGRPVSGVSERASHNRVGMKETLRRLAEKAEADA